ncbi:hypothetical protein GCM10009754_18040 [Amycolatopsis minnesotensis]|uniref:Uncharacterized protein n=1 Tax=Amycolatopsis minnesotensis TaxID=337894 RepID=A0ABN2QES1_9PSEU
MTFAASDSLKGTFRACALERSSPGEGRIRGMHIPEGPCRGLSADGGRGAGGEIPAHALKVTFAASDSPKGTFRACAADPTSASIGASFTALSAVKVAFRVKGARNSIRNQVPERDPQDTEPRAALHTTFTGSSVSGFDQEYPRGTPDKRSHRACAQHLDEVLSKGKVLHPLPTWERP